MKFGTGGEGKVGENNEELEPHLLVALARWEMVGRGLVDGVRVGGGGVLGVWGGELARE